MKLLKMYSWLLLVTCVLIDSRVYAALSAAVFQSLEMIDTESES